MEFFEVIESRRSVRQFQPKPVEKAKIDQILGAVLRAPSARGKRSWEFVVVDRPQLLEQLARAKPSGGGFLKKAPLAIVVCTDPAKANPWIEDGAIAAIYIQLAAQAVGLGSCWAHFRNKAYTDTQSSKARIADLLQLPAHLEVECAIAIGYPDQAVAPYPTAALPKDKINYNRWGDQFGE